MYINILILAHLAVRPYHGYELKRQVEQSLGGALTLNNNHLYPALKQFEQAGVIYREVEHNPGHPDRHIYHITDQGETVLQKLLQDFPLEMARNDNEFLTRVAFFHLLDQGARIAILHRRQEALKQHRYHLDTVLKQVQEGTHPSYPYTPFVLRLQQERLSHEEALIAKFIDEIMASAC